MLRSSEIKSNKQSYLLLHLHSHHAIITTPTTFTSNSPTCCILFHLLSQPYHLAHFIYSFYCYSTVCTLSPYKNHYFSLPLCLSPPANYETSTTAFSFCFLGVASPIGMSFVILYRCRAV